MSASSSSPQLLATATLQRDSVRWRHHVYYLSDMKTNTTASQPNLARTLWFSRALHRHLLHPLWLSRRVASSESGWSYGFFLLLRGMVLGLAGIAEFILGNCTLLPHAPLSRLAALTLIQPSP